MKSSSRTIVPLAIAAIALGLPAQAAVPVSGQLTPVAVYHSTPSAFGLAFDSAHNLIWYSEGDSGDTLLHSLKPFNAYTPAQLAALPQSGGVYNISLAAGLNDVAGTTGGISHYFTGVAYDSGTGQLVNTSYSSGGGNVLKSFDPFTGANLNSNYAPGSATDSFADGLDVDSGNVWFSPDVGPIYKNGVLFASAATANTALTGLPGTHSVSGFSGVEQVGNSLFAVAVGNFNGEERTIFKFDIATGALTGYDPDGDPAAVRWEDLAFDGRYLYAADLRGNRDGSGVPGDIYVFDTGGGIIIEPPSTGVPDAGSSLLLLTCALSGLAAFARRLRRV